MYPIKKTPVQKPFATSKQDPAWSRIRSALVTSLAVVSVLAANSRALGATYYWDFDGDATIGVPPASTAGSGTWNTGNINWNLNGSAGSDVAWVNGSDAVFAGSDGTYAISLGNTLSVGNLVFNNSGYTLSAASAQSLSNTVGNNSVTVSGGKTATIGNNVTFTNGFNNGVVSLLGTSAPGGSVGTLIIDSGGRVQTTFGNPLIYIGSVANSAGSLRATTVQVNAGGSIQSAGTNGAVVVNGLLKVNGGSVGSAGTGIIAIGNFSDANMVASSILTIDSGTVTTNAGLRFGASAASSTSGGTLNLNGGTLVAGKIYSSGSASASTVNFNGGTLKATANNNSDFLNTNINNAIVKSGGAIIDTNSFNVTIQKALTHDASLGGTVDGGLTKNSLGTLLLSGANTFTGTTTVSGGVLKVGAGGALNSSAALVVNSGATLENANGSAITPRMTLQEGATVLTSAAGSSFAPVSMTLTGDLSDGFTAIALTNTSGGGLIKGGSLTLSLSGIAEGTYSLTSGSGFSGSFTSANVNGSALTASGADFTGSNIGGFNYSYINATNQLVVTAVPEPAAIALLTGGMGFLLLRRRGRSISC